MQSHNGSEKICIGTIARDRLVRKIRAREAWLNPVQRGFRKSGRALVALGAPLLLGLVLAASLSGCGKEAFLVVNGQQASTSPGSFNIPPKVDILLVEDDTGARNQIYNSSSAEIRSFLGSLDSAGWDYHFTSIRNSGFRQVTQVVGSQYDPNWVSLGGWKKPFPSATADQVLKIDPSVFVTSNQYSNFVQASEIRFDLNGKEPALDTLLSTLNDGGFQSTGFMRSDSILVVVTFSNGEDTSKVNICNRSDGLQVPCDSVYGVCASTWDDSNAWPTWLTRSNEAVDGSRCGSNQLSKDYYATQISYASQKLNPLAQVRVFATYNGGGGNCSGAIFNLGRYTSFANAFGGQALNICSQGSLSNVLASLKSNLQTLKLQYKTRYVFIDQEPELSSISVTRVSANGAKSVIPQSSSNGWSYAGYKQNVPTIQNTDVVPAVYLNYGSGWAIRLSGSGMLSGDETSIVSYRPKGSQNSAK